MFLTAVFAPALERPFDLALDLIINSPGDAYATWVGELFQAGGHVHTIAVTVAVFLDDNVTQVHPVSDLERAWEGF
jgi:hypothetical protein